MTKIKSGLIVAGVGLNIFGHLAATFAPASTASLPMVGALALLMVASVVFVLLGFFRLIVGLVSGKKQAEAHSIMSADDMAWPPDSKPLGAMQEYCVS